MTAAAIAAQLVDMRNVGTHKVMKLTIHVPEEQALAAIAAFGWPTGVNPVPIAIARMGTARETEREPAGDASSELSQRVESPHKTKTAFRDMRLANQAGLLCDTLSFQRFITELIKSPALLNNTAAADYVRRYCNVASRSDIRPDTVSGKRWQKLVAEYRAWMHAPEMVA